MKKQLPFLIIAFILICFFSCNMDFTLPKEIQITGNPELKFAAGFDLGSEFAQDIDGIFQGFTGSGKKTIECINTNIVTYILYNLVLEEDIDMSVYATIIGGAYPYIVPTDWTLISAGSKQSQIPAINLSSFVENFSFKNYITNLYISGTEIVNILTVDLNIPGVNAQKGNRSTTLGSLEVYTGTSLPEGIHIDMEFTGEPITINPVVTIKAGERINASMMNNQKLKIEIAVWLPMILTADGSAEFALPELFKKGDDLFGRTSEASENSIANFVESLNIEVSLSGSPFRDAILAVESTAGVTIITPPFSGNKLGFNISEEKLSEINGKYPFDPQFKLLFESGGILQIPRVFNTSEVALNAKLNYAINLGIN